MKPPLFLSSIIFLLFATATLPAQKSGNYPLVQAKIESSHRSEIFEVKALATNREPVFQELNYVLIAMKDGAGGNRSTNKQDGKFVIQPNESKQLSQMGINVQPKDHLKIYLYIRDEKTNTLISKDSLEINPKKKALARKR